MHARYRVGIDVGGTFTDVVVVDDAHGRIHTHKLSSTPDEPHAAPVRGIVELLDRLHADRRMVGFVGLGTTVATNALLERKGARTGLITTAGFGDLIEIGRQTRPHLYDPDRRKPPPLVPAQRRMEVEERIDAHGDVLQPLDEASVGRAVTRLRAAGVESIAICFLNAYVNPSHERRARALVERLWPEACVVTSSQISQEFREFERFASTVVNAFLMPAMRDYFAAFEREIAALGIPVQPVVLSSSGGMFTPAMGAQRPIDTLFSGPSGGVGGATFLAALAGLRDLVTFDMGGTSTEVCLVRDGVPQQVHLREVAGHPIRSTSPDIHTIGAGGSSLASIDDGTLLRIGPDSAGADPGPACYGRARGHATITDANVLLGRLNRQALLDGALPIDAALSTDAITASVAAPRGLDAVTAAEAMTSLAEANMAQALRVVSIERGVDPATLTLVAFGGAGPLHAAAVAREVGMAAVLVPPYPGVLCAMGVLTQDLERHVSRTGLLDAADAGFSADADRLFAELESAAGTDLADAGPAPVQYRRSAGIRYRGQSHEIDLPLPREPWTADTVAALTERFHVAHAELHGYGARDRTIQLVTARVTASIAVPRPRIEAVAPAPHDRSELPALRADSPAPISRRDTIFDGIAHDCAVYRREALVAGDRIDGPAIVEQMDTTTVVPPEFHAAVDPWGNLVIRWPAEEEPS